MTDAELLVEMGAAVVAHAFEQGIPISAGMVMTGKVSLDELDEGGEYKPGDKRIVQVTITQQMIDLAWARRAAGAVLQYGRAESPVGERLTVAPLRDEPGSVGRLLEILKRRGRL